MDHGIHPLHRGRQRLAVEYTPNHHLALGPLHRDHVEKAHRVVSNQSTPYHATDLAGRAGDQYLHHTPPPQTQSLPGKPLRVPGFSPRNGFPGRLGADGTRLVRRGIRARRSISGAKTACQSGTSNLGAGGCVPRQGSWQRGTRAAGAEGKGCMAWKKGRRRPPAGKMRRRCADS